MMCPIYTIGSFYVGPEMHMSAQIKKLEVGPIKKKVRSRLIKNFIGQVGSKMR